MPEKKPQISAIQAKIPESLRADFERSMQEVEDLYGYAADVSKVLSALVTRFILAPPMIRMEMLDEGAPTKIALARARAMERAEAEALMNGAERDERAAHVSRPENRKTRPKAG